MRTIFLAQPERRIGDFLLNELQEHGPPEEFVIVSAFASLSAVLRVKASILDTIANGGVARLVVGVDLGGTSKQVLQELAGWAAPVIVIKNAIPAVTFHPKIYMLRWHDRAFLAVGSSNLTDGGLFRNMEATALAEFALPADQTNLAQATAELSRFLNPTGAIAKPLTADYLADLIALPEIPTEAEARKRRGDRRTTPANRPANVFGREDVPDTPILPPELQALLVAARRSQFREFNRAKARSRRAAAARPPLAMTAPAELGPPLATLDASYFYVTLPTMHADNPRIPGEMRIPLEALEVAPDFWGWPDLYERREDSPRAGAHATEVRVYRDRRSRWRTTSTLPTAPPAIEADVRMYMYENSSDFRLMIGAVNQFGGKKGDIIRIKPIFGGNVGFECTLASVGTAEYSAWLPLLVNEVRGSDRRFGYT